LLWAVVGDPLSGKISDPIHYTFFSVALTPFTRVLIQVLSFYNVIYCVSTCQHSRHKYS
jgi:hypothetical protein